jgi:uncharacterized protein YbcI
MRKEKISKLQTMTKGQMEADISNALIAFEKEHMGRGPEDVRTHIIQDMVLIRLKGVLAPAERHLARDQEGVNSLSRSGKNYWRTPPRFWLILSKTRPDVGQ